MLPQAGPEALATADTVVIPGTRYPPARVDGVLTAEVAAALALIRPGTRLVSICTGAFVLAAAGLLDGRPATTHWRFADDLRRLHPEVLLDENVLFVDDGDVLTSAGLAAGIDLCLHIIRSDHGAQVANAVARYCVVPPWREGGQAQFIDRQVPAPDHFSTAATREWALQHLDEELTVQRLARHAKYECAHVQPAVPGGNRSGARARGYATAASTAPANCSSRRTCRSTRWPGCPGSARAATCATICAAASACRRRATARSTRGNNPFHLQHIAHRGACGKTRVVPQNDWPKPEPADIGGSEMRVLLWTWGSRGDVEPMLGFAVALRALGAEVRMCAPPDFAELLARVDVPMVPVGRSVRALVHGDKQEKPSTPADAPRVAAELVAAQFESLGAAAEGCDALVAIGI